MANNKIMRFVMSAVVLVALMTLTAFAADITGGFGAIGGVDDTYYAAPATLNAAGDGLDLGEAIQLTDANNTGLAGLYAVSTDSTVTFDDEIVYVYGDMASRQTLVKKWVSGDTDPVSGDAVTDGHRVNKIKTIGSYTNKFATGYWTGAGYWGTHSSYRAEEMLPAGSQQFGSDFKKAWFFNNTWDTALDEVEPTATSNAVAYVKTVATNSTKTRMKAEHPDLTDPKAEKYVK